MKRKTKLLFRDAFFSTILSSLIILVLLLAIFNLRFFNPISKAFYDFSFLDVFYSEKLLETENINTDIVLVNAGRNRENLVEILTKIVEAEPKTIGVDVIFRERKEPVYVDSNLARYLRNSNVITSYNFDNGTITGNHEFFRNANPGFVNFNFNNSTTVREFESYRAINSEDHWSFPSEVARHYLNDKWTVFGYSDKLKRTQTLKFFGDYDSFTYLDYEDFNNYEKKKILKDKIVIIGYLGYPTGNVYDIEDKWFTPLNQYSVGRSEPDMYGAVIHANIVNMLINNDFMLTISNTWLVIITFLVMYLSTLYYMKINRKYKVSYRTRKRIYQFCTSIFVLLLSLWLYRNNVVLKPSIVIIGIILAGSYFKYFKHLTRYLKSKTNKKWKTYLK